MPSDDPKQAREPGIAASLLFRTTLVGSDRDKIETILRAVRVFSETEIQVGLELVDETLHPGPSTDYRWILAERGPDLLGYACFGPVPLTKGTFDLYWLAVAPAEQGLGIARQLEERICLQLKGLGARWLLVETSSLPQFDPARDFYGAQGYRLLSWLPDFYAERVDRFSYAKRLDAKENNSASTCSQGIAASGFKA